MLFGILFPYFWFGLGILTAHVATKCIKFLFHMENHIYWFVLVKSVESISRINWRLENIWKKEHLICFASKPRCWDFKPMSEKTDPKPMIGFPDYSIPMIRNVGPQPFLQDEPWPWLKWYFFFWPWVSMLFYW